MLYPALPPSAVDAGLTTEIEQGLLLPRWNFFAIACALVAAAAGLATALPVSAKSPGMKGSPTSDRAYCQQRAREDDTDMAACMKEMAAARSVRSSELTNPDMPARQDNTDARCGALPMDQRDACMVRQRGMNTTTSGSVKGGGVLRETRQVVPGAAGGASAPR